MTGRSDDKERLNVRLSIIELRTNYHILYDMIMKCRPLSCLPLTACRNIDKIRVPRSTMHVHNMF